MEDEVGMGIDHGRRGSATSGVLVGARGQLEHAVDNKGCESLPSQGQTSFMLCELSLAIQCSEQLLQVLLNQCKKTSRKLEGHMVGSYPTAEELQKFLEAFTRENFHRYHRA